MIVAALNSKQALLRQNWQENLNVSMTKLKDIFRKGARKMPYLPIPKVITEFCKHGFNELEVIRCDGFHTGS